MEHNISLGLRQPAGGTPSALGRNPQRRSCQLFPRGRVSWNTGISGIPSPANPPGGRRGGKHPPAPSPGSVETGTVDGGVLVRGRSLPQCHAAHTQLGNPDTHTYRLAREPPEQNFPGAAPPNRQFPILHGTPLQRRRMNRVVIPPAVLDAVTRAHRRSVTNH